LLLGLKKESSSFDDKNGGGAGVVRALEKHYVDFSVASIWEKPAPD